MNEEYWNLDKMKTEKKELLNLVDEKGFCIKDHVLIAYIGTQKKITIPKNVTQIGEACFMDAYVKEVFYPKSVTKAGGRLMETEEGLSGAVIHVVSGSYMENYFKMQMPYGDCSLKVD